MLTERVRCRETEREEGFDELSKESRAFFFRVNFQGGLAGAHDVGQMHPRGQKLSDHMAIQCAVEGGFRGDEKRGGIRRERVAIAFFMEQAEADEKIEDAGDAAL